MVRNQPIDYIVCAAGRGLRLKEAVPHLPKPLAKLHGQTMLERSLASLDFQTGDRLIIVSQRSHGIRAQVEKQIKRNYSHVEIKWLELSQHTSGQLETALQAKDFVRNGNPVAIFNADTYFKMNSDWLNENVDGAIPCAHAEGEAWSFCQVDADGWVKRVTEKERISDRASVGFYYFRNFELLSAAADAELKEARNREAFVAPIYNHLIAEGKKISSPIVDEFQPMGTLDQIETFWKVGADELKKQNQPSVVLNFAAAFAGLLVTLLLLSPGILDNDTEWQLNQALNHDYNNWHPPLLSYIWHWLLFIFPKTWGLFLLNNVMFWSGLALTMRALLKDRPQWAPLCTLAVGLCPWMFTYNALVWKDATFGSAMLLATGLILQTGSNRSKYSTTAIILCLSLAVGVRHNGIAGALPLFFLLAQSFHRPLVSALIMAALSYGLNGFIASKIARDDVPSQVFLTFDLGGISVHSKKNLFPPSVFPEITLQDLNREYLPFNVLPLLWATSSEDKNHRPGFIQPEDFPKLRKAWASAVWHHPNSYWLHRLAFTKSLLGLEFIETTGGLHLPLTLVPKDPSLFRSDRLTTLFLSEMHTMQTKSYFTRGITFLLALMLLGIYFGFFGTIAENALVFSGLLYFASFVATGVASDFRYLWWMAIVATILFVRFAFTELERVGQYLKSTQ